MAVVKDGVTLIADAIRKENAEREKEQTANDIKNVSDAIKQFAKPVENKEVEPEKKTEPEPTPENEPDGDKVNEE